MTISTVASVTTMKKKKCIVVEGYSTGSIIGVNSSRSSTTSHYSSTATSLQQAASSFIKRSGGGGKCLTTTISASNTTTDSSKDSVIIIPSYPANDYVERRHFIFCIILAAIFSHGGLNILLMNSTGSSSTSNSGSSNHHNNGAPSFSLASSMLSSSIGTIGGGGGGIFSASRTSGVIDRHHDASSSSAAAADNKSHDDYFAQVRVFLNANEPRMALEELLEADSFYPEDVELKLYLGSTYTLLIEYDKAIGAYQQALDLIERHHPHFDADNVYKMRALTMMGVLHRGRGRIDQAIEWLQKSVAHNGSDRENRNYLAQCHFLTGNILDGTEHLIEVVRQDLAVDEDYRLLSYALSAMEEWQLLGAYLQQCLYYGYCSLSNDSLYSTDQILIEYAVALDKAGQSESALIQLQEAARIASTKSQAAQPQTLQDARQRAQTYIQEAQEGTRKALAWNDQQKDQAVFKEEAARRWEEMAQVLRTSMRIGVPAWSTMFERHYSSFRWPIPSVLVDLISKEIKQDKAAVKENSLTPFLLPNRITEIVSKSACHMLNVYTFSDCIFYAKASGAKRQQAIRLENKVSIQTYNDFQQATYRPLLDTNILHLGIFSDLKYPMVNMVWSLILNTHRKNNANTNIRVTLYHPRDVTPSVLDFVVPLVSNAVECTEETWVDCVEHARRNKVQVWLEASGDSVEGIPNIMASGPAPVGISWGDPGSLGLPSTVQYMITDRYSVPPESAVSAEYPEKMIYVPGSWLYVEPEALRVGNLTIASVRTEYNIPSEAVIYCCFGRLSKITDETFRLWSAIVSKVPGSVLVICNWHPSNDPIPRMRKTWRDQGLASDRLIVFPLFSFGGHLSILSALSDATTIALDALDYSGAMTAYNAIQAGVPVIHCSNSWKITQRMAGSVLAAAGLGKDLIVTTAIRYEELSVLMGTNATFYQEIKSKTVNARPFSPLFQNRYGLSGMLAGLRMAYKLWYAGRPPQTMYADTPQEFPEERKSNKTTENVTAKQPEPRNAFASTG